MRKIVTILTLLTVFVAKSQSVKNQILDNISEIKSVNIKSDDFSDLEIIGKSIGDAKIVFLGEQSHGDATAFEAKGRLVKYLHEQKGFNVLAFESDFFNINKKADEKQPTSEIEKNIFGIWSDCVQVNPLFDYIEKQYKSNPLIISGFDCQIGQNKYENSKTMYVNTMKLYIKKNVDISQITNYDLFVETLTDLIFYVQATETEKAHYIKVKRSVQKKYFKTLSEILNKIQDKKSFLFMSLKSAGANAKMAWANKFSSQERDTQMGENILWLHKVKFPKEKIIIWAHSGHLVRKITNKKGKRKTFFKNISAGEYVCDRLDKNEVYSIGFSSRKGATQYANSKFSQKLIIKPSKLDTFENWIHNKKYNFAFIDFKSLKNNSETFHLRGTDHISIFKANWLTAFDGIFYIEEMFPCTTEK